MFKKLTIILTLISFVIIGCGAINNIRLADQNETMNIVLKIAARRAAVKFLEKNPDEVERVKSYCNRILNDEINQVILDEIANYLSKKIGDDPLLEQDLKDLSGLIVIDVSDINFDAGLIKIVAQGFIEGTNLLE